MFEKPDTPGEIKAMDRFFLGSIVLILMGSILTFVATGTSISILNIIHVQQDSSDIYA
jgi:hypothetical protein